MALSRGCSLPVDFATLRAACAAYRATALLLGSQPAPAGMCSSFQFPVCLLRSRSCRPTGCLWQAVLVRILPRMSHPTGCLCSLPRNRPVAWFPASARWHVFAPAQLIRRISPTCSSFGAALRQSISTFPEGLDSPFGLPSAVVAPLRYGCPP